ncbi:OB-fold domain-containing protein, partial [Streptomyces boncukensis]|nr:protein dehydratase [Streptomyces boncukensis]
PQARPDPSPARRRPRPVVNRDNAGFWDGVAGHRLLLQRCDSCAALRFPWLPGCNSCGAADWSPVEASGRGTVYSYVVVHHPSLPGRSGPYAVALVELAEGVRIVSGITGVPPGEVRIGMPVELGFERVDEELELPVFRAAAPAEGGGPQPLEVPVTRTLVVAGAVASRDFQDVHHDAEAARENGSPDMFMNILTTNGLVGRYVAEWAGPSARLRRVAIRLGVPNYPGDTMTLTGRVTAAGDDGTVELSVTGRNRLGTHVSGTVAVSIPGPAPAPGPGPGPDPA